MAFLHLWISQWNKTKHSFKKLNYFIEIYPVRNAWYKMFDILNIMVCWNYHGNFLEGSFEAGGSTSKTMWRQLCMRRLQLVLHAESLRICRTALYIEYCWSKARPGVSCSWNHPVDSRQEQRWLRTAIWTQPSHSENVALRLFLQFVANIQPCIFFPLIHLTFFYLRGAISWWFCTLWGIYFIAPCEIFILSYFYAKIFLGKKKDF